MLPVSQRTVHHPEGVVAPIPPVRPANLRTPDGAVKHFAFSSPKAQRPDVPAGEVPRVERRESETTTFDRVRSSTAERFTNPSLACWRSISAARILAENSAAGRKPEASFLPRSDDTPALNRGVWMWRGEPVRLV